MKTNGGVRSASPATPHAARQEDIVCGRIGQFSAWQSYIEALQAFRETYARHDGAVPRYNAGPGTRIAVIHANGDVRPVWWGYRPSWAVARKIPAMINARGDKIVSTAWKGMLRDGRVIVPADCWYEWIKAPDGSRQPYLLRGRDAAPLFFAGLRSGDADLDNADGLVRDGGGVVNGVVIVTDASDAGIIDIHDRRPVALSAADARLWLEPDTSADMAAEIARTGNASVDAFEWFPVSKKLNNTRNDDVSLIAR